MSVTSQELEVLSLNHSYNRKFLTNVLILQLSFLSYDVAVIQWLTSCHKNRMTTRYITLGYWRVTS